VIVPIARGKMSYADAVARVAQIEAERAILPTAFDPPKPASTSFADTLAEAQAGHSAQPTASAASLESPAQGTLITEQQQLTTGQQQFASRLSADTGLDRHVIAAWLLAEESGGASKSRQEANNNDWLNIGYTDSATYGSSDSIWSSPITAADATAGWLRGQNTIPGYGKASSGVQAILNTAGQPAQTQISTIQGSGWASSGYPDLPALYRRVVG
jgi:hypothetical protein